MDFQHTGSLRTTSPAGTVVSSSTRPQRDGVWTPASVGPAAPGQMLLQEVLWQLERRALQVQEEEFRYCMSRGILGHHHPRAFTSVIALIPPAEYHQLERLCGRVPPLQNAIVLSRIYDLLAHNDIPPWELVNVFKQVLQDFLRRQDECAISSASMTFLPILEKAPKSRAQKPLVDEFE